MKGFHRNSSSSQIHPAHLFLRNIKIVFLENKCTLEKNWKLILRLLKATCFFCEHPAVFLHPCRQQCNSCFLEMVLNLHWALLAANWWQVAKQTQSLFSGLIKRSAYNPGSVIKLPFLKMKFSLKSYMQCHYLNTVSDNLHCVSKKQ